MIDSLALRSFKAFKDTGKIALKPLTILAGANSSGKSSILQSLLLLKQTLEATRTDGTELVLSGPYLQFSSLSEIAFGKPAPGQARIAYEFSLTTPIPASAVSRYIPELEIDRRRKVLDLQSELKFEFRHRQYTQADEETTAVDRFALTNSVQGVSGPEFEYRWSPRGRRWRVSTSGSGVDLPARFEGRKLVGVAGRAFLPDAVLVDPSEEEILPPEARLNPIFINPIRALESTLRNGTAYLGPLREEPHRAYLHSGESLPEIGAKGEYAAQVLWLERDSEVQYRPRAGNRARSLSLLGAVNAAFKDLGMAHKMEVDSWQSILYQVTTGIGRGRAVSIADVGFGVSQLLPVLLLGLRADYESMLLFEQPEIHLHPRVQANLADFFLGAAELNGGCIVVETHSDHFINRIRRRIAEDKTDTLRDLVNVLFVRASPSHMGSTLERLDIDEFGVIQNWPADFLPEASDEAGAILRASLAKRGDRRGRG